MIVGVLDIELFIPSSTSLKAKRSVIKSLKDRLTNGFNISVAEVGYADKWQRCALGVAVLSNEKTQAERVLSKVLLKIYEEYRVEITHSLITYY